MFSSIARTTAVSLALAAVAFFATPAAAPAGEAMLVVTNTADPATPTAEFSERDLMEMTQVRVRTATEFTDGMIEFVGPLARDAVGRVGTGGADTVHLVAVNDYTVDVPLSDFMEYDVILALYADGERLSLRDKGPIWLMYPIDDHQELQDSDYNRKLIWQLSRIELR